MTDDISTTTTGDSKCWRNNVAKISIAQIERHLHEPAYWRPPGAPMEGYRLEPYLVEFPGSPLVVLTLSDAWDEQRRLRWLSRLRDPHTGKIRPRGPIQGLSKSARNRHSVQIRRLIPSSCIHQSLGMALCFPLKSVFEEKIALKKFNAFIKRIERWAARRNAKISGYRAMERGPDGFTVHFHAWLWISVPGLLDALRDLVEDKWPEIAGYKQRESTATNMQTIKTEAELHAFLWYMLKEETKEHIHGVHPVAPIRQQNLPLGKPCIEELDVAQALFLKKFINRILKRRNDPTPRKMIVNFPQEKWKRIKRKSYKYRVGPTPSEDLANKIREAEADVPLE